ncbi:Rrf2 family transcriptional regulator [Paenibacillus sp. SI8]|uniref:Rrf2 family transcriptional regulator n=1 Tax=unclassified Paenibacillus TaxID=185978 RepID=UPI00346717B6
MSTKNNAITIGPPRFSIAVHALVWLTQSGGVLSSAVIADQVNSHATFLRRVLASLVHAGLVEAREGREGGYTLNRAPEHISLADVYLAVKGECTEAAAEVDCGEAGKQLDQVIDNIMTAAETKTIEHLRLYSIVDIMGSIDFSSKK